MLLLVFAICTPAFTIMVPISIFGIASDMLSLWLIFSNLFFFLLLHIEIVFCDEYKYMLCLEVAAIEKPITLQPGEE